MPSTHFLVKDPSKYGILKDLQPHDLPHGAWSDGANVEFEFREIVKAIGFTVVKSSTAIAPHQLFLVNYQQTTFWVYCGLTDVRAFDDVTETEITNVGGDYAGADFNRWNGGVFNGILVINNGVDVPQMWNTPGLSTPLTDLSNWVPGHLSTLTAKVIRPFGNFLVALDTVEDGTRFPYRVRVSHSAASGVPSSWDETDATKDTYVQDLGGTQDILIDAAVLGNSLILYKENTVWAMRFVGGALKFSIQKLFNAQGIMSQDCATVFKRKHLVLTREDVIVHDGVNSESVIDGRNRRYLFNNMEPQATLSSFVTHVEARDEIWILVPKLGQGAVTEAAIWNYKENTWTFRDVDGISAVVSAQPATASVGDSWNSEALIQWSSVVDADSAADPNKVLNVDVTAGFRVGDRVTIDPDGSGGGLEEDHIVASIQDGISLTMEAVLDNAHSAAQADQVDNMSLVWDDTRFIASEKLIYFASADNMEILKLDDSLYTDQTANYRSWIERVGIAIIGKDREGELIEDERKVKMLQSVWPEVNAAAGVQINVYVEARDSMEETVDWQGPFIFTVGTNEHVNFPPLTGRFLGVRFEATESDFWSLHGYSLEIAVLGEH